MKDDLHQQPRTGPKARARFLHKLLELERPMEIADIGARKIRSGAPYDTLMRIEGAARLSCFEPDPDAFKALSAEAPANATCYQAALGKPGPATFYSHQIGTLSSVFKFSEAAARYLGKLFWVKREITEVPMELVALDEIDDVPALDVLKMDVQGAEFDILQGAKRTLSDAICVIPEVRFYQIYEGEPHWADVDAELRAQGFVLHKFLHLKSVTLPGSQKARFSKAGRSQLLDGDAVYIRKLEDPEALSVTQLKMLALAADAIFASPDLTAHCLDALASRGAVKSNAAGRYVGRVPSQFLIEETAP